MTPPLRAVLDGLDPALREVLVGLQPFQLRVVHLVYFEHRTTRQAALTLAADERDVRSALAAALRRIGRSTQPRLH